MILWNNLGTVGKCGTLKQAVQARAVEYDESVDLSWFTKGTNISKKANTMHDRRRVRSQLVGAALLVAQMGLLAITNRHPGVGLEY